MAALHGQGHARTRDLRLVRAQDHLQGRHGIAGARKGCAVFLDGSDQVDDGQLIAALQRPLFDLFEPLPLLLGSGRLLFRRRSVELPR